MLTPQISDSINDIDETEFIAGLKRSISQMKSGKMEPLINVISYSKLKKR